MRRPLPLDYDHNPDRFRTGRAVVHEFGLAGDIHTPVAARLLRETGGRALDMGCGDGVLGRLLLGSALRWIGIDLSLTLLSDAPRPAVLGDAACLPFSSDSFAAVAALFVLYHLGEPRRAIREAHRGDMVLIAGKGHEDYQIIGTKKFHFDDREVAREAIQQLRDCA